MTPSLVLISHVLCPYVQRAVIVMTEKGIEFQRHDIDLMNKPDWFLKLSPLGKTPVLLVDGQPVFESAVICEYLDEIVFPPLHPRDALERAQHRAWIEFASASLNAIAGFYGAPDEAGLAVKARDIQAKFAQIESALTTKPYFAGERFSIVDAAFAPVFRYFDVFDSLRVSDFFCSTPKVRAWRSALAERESVVQAVQTDYPQLLRRFLASRKSALSAYIGSP